MIVNYLLKEISTRFFFLFLVLLLQFICTSFTVDEKTTAANLEGSQTTEKPGIRANASVVFKKEPNNVKTPNGKSKSSDTLAVIFKIGKTQVSTAKDDNTKKYCIGASCVSLTVFIVIIVIPSIIILTLTALLVIYIIRRKQKYKPKPEKVESGKKLIPLEEERISTRPAISVGTESTVSGAQGKPLRNMSDESDISRSVKMSTSSEKEDEKNSPMKPLIKKKKKKNH